MTMLIHGYVRVTVLALSNNCFLCVYTRRYRAIYDVIDMPWDWPVDVNYHEAKAFCSWKGPDYRLPTEAEHHRMRGDGVSARVHVQCLYMACIMCALFDFNPLSPSPRIRAVIPATRLTILPTLT